MQSKFNFHSNALHVIYRRHGAPSSVGAIVDAMRDVCSHRNLAHLSYFGVNNSLSDNNITSFITTCDEKWNDLYFKNCYFRIDPVIKIGAFSVLPMNWAEVEINTAEMEALYRESWKFGVGRFGLTVRVCGAGTDIGLVSLSLNCPVRQWQIIFDQLACELLYLANILHYQILNINSQSEPAQISLLTKREREVLEWAARGKTAWETSRILGISDRTAEFYIAKACRKLRVSSKPHAVAKLFSGEGAPL